MSRFNDFPDQPHSPSQTLWPSRFREHLSLTFTADDLPIERSQFSPDSPSDRRSLHIGRLSAYKPNSARDIERAYSVHSHLHPSGFRDRFTRLFSDPHVSHQEPELHAPVQQPWPPLNVEKRHPQCVHHERPLNTWRRRAANAGLCVFLLFVLVDLVVLNVRTFSPSHLIVDTSQRTGSVAPETPTTASNNTQQCISQYTTSAPTSYPCSTCLPLLAAVPPSSADIYPAALNGTQFCALRALWEDTDSGGQATLQASGWVQDIKFCVWGGVQCDGTGKVPSLCVLVFFFSFFCSISLPTRSHC